MYRLKTIFPIINWMSNYNGRLFKWDLIAGITLATFVLPESMAYASLAGLPAQYGIYCCIAGGLLFAIFTSSKQLVVGPTSAISLMVGSTLAVMAVGDPGKWIAIASLTAFTVFLLCMVAYFLRLSSLVNFIGENILLGFKTGAALSIASTQLPALFGVRGGGANFFERIYSLTTQLQETNITIFLFGISALALLISGSRLIPGRPVVLIIVVVSILMTTFIPFFTSTIHMIGEIPAGLPEFTIPSIRFSDVDGILGLALGLFMLSYVETISAARTLADKNGYEVNPRQELLSLGAANLSTAFTGGYPVAGGLSQSTVNDKAGAKTPASLIICSFVLSILLLNFTGLLKNLPEVILAVIVLDAITGLVKVRELRNIYIMSKTEFYVAALAIAGVLFFGILQGILIAAVSSLIIIIARVTIPRIAILGNIPGTNKYSDIHRHPDNEEIGGCMIFRIETSVLYFNQQNIYNRICELISSGGDGVKLVIIDMSSAPGLDISGSKMLLKLSKELEEKKIALRLVEALSEVRELLRKQGMEEVIGHISRKVSINDVVSEFKLV